MVHNFVACHEKFLQAFRARYPNTPLESRRVRRNESEWQPEWDVWQLHTETGLPVEYVGRFKGCCSADAVKAVIRLRAHDSMEETE